MGITDAVLETGGCERFGGEVFSLVELGLRAEIGRCVSVGSSADGDLRSLARVRLQTHRQGTLKICRRLSPLLRDKVRPMPMPTAIFIE